MNILAIETSTDQMGVALVNEARVLASYELLADRPHGVELPQAVTRVLRGAGQTLDQVDAFAIDIGPGSFTGLRIGMAFVKALVFRVKKPLAGVASLDVLAAGIPYSTQVICPIMDAKRRQVYAARYQALEGHLTKQSDYQLMPADELHAWLDQPPTTSPSADAAAPTTTRARRQEIVFLGDGVGLYQAKLAEQFGTRATFAFPETWWPRAATLGRLGLERLTQGFAEDPSTLVPMYMYPMDCSVRKDSQPTSSSPQASHAT